MNETAYWYDNKIEWLNLVKEIITEENFSIDNILCQLELSYLSFT